MSILRKQTLRKLLEEEGISARKSLGQHFLISRQVLEEILKASQLTKQDFVVEVGAGLGSLTLPLAQKAGSVLAIDKDPRMLAVLKELAQKEPNIEVITADVLALPKSFFAEKAALWKALKRRHFNKSYKEPAYKVVANLPYYITSNVLRLFLENEERPSLMVVMVQKEVAEKIVAKPGEMSLLSLSVQLFGLPRIIKKISKEAFFPKPKIDSAILSIRTYESWPWAIDDVRGFFKLARLAFHAKRKQIATNLREGLKLSREEVAEALAKTHVRPEERAEDLSLKDWEELFLVFRKRL